MFCIFKKNKDISTIYPEIEKKNYTLFENIIKKDLLGKYTLKNTFESWLTKTNMLKKTSDFHIQSGPSINNILPKKKKF
jgi:hypothetical protein